MGETDQIEELKRRISAIEARNKRVETIKAWETSYERSISILIITYALATLVMWGIDTPRPWINAVIPTLGYYLSFQSLPFIQKWWQRRR